VRAEALSIAIAHRIRAVVAAERARYTRAERERGRMASYNKVILMGNLTRKPELRFTQSGTATCKFGLAVNRRYKDQSGEWKEEPTFIDVTIFGKRGEAFAKYHDKGKTAFVEGRLSFSTWQDKQSGEKRSKLEVIGEEWQFVGAGGGAGREMGGAGPDDSAASAGGYAGGYSGEGGGEALGAAEDTPF
jgi:single-strand DNA-binding protein